MKTRTIVIFGGMAIFVLFILGCSAAGSIGGGTIVLNGSDAVVVKAKQPAAPEPPKPAPKAAVVGKKIEISEKVMFSKGEATILPESDALLKDIAKVLTDNPDIKEVRIEGHTSSEGTNEYNKKLSDERAKSVRDYLINLEVDGIRLTAEGFGEDTPISSNDTEAGKEKNRRVEFQITKRAEKK